MAKTVMSQPRQHGKSTLVRASKIKGSRGDRPRPKFRIDTGQPCPNSNCTSTNIHSIMGTRYCADCKFPHPIMGTRYCADCNFPNVMDVLMFGLVIIDLTLFALSFAGCAPTQYPNRPPTEHELRTLEIYRERPKDLKRWLNELETRGGNQFERTGL